MSWFRIRWSRASVIPFTVLLILSLLSNTAFAVRPSFLCQTDLATIGGGSEGATATAGEAGDPTTQNGAGHPVAESLFSKEYFKLLFEDTKYVLTSPGRWERKEWLGFSLAALGVASAAVLDKPLWDFMRRNQGNPGNSVADVLATVGGVYSVALFLPFYVAGKATDNPRAVNVALDGWSASLIAAGIVAPTLKFLVGRSTPEADEGTYTFRPFTYRLQMNGGPQSFPSGHAAQGFAVASVIAGHYEEPWIKILAFGMASLTSTARLYQGEHFLSDWAAGALIGTFVGTTVVHFNEKRRREKKEQQVFILPLMRPGAMGLTVSIRQ